MIPTANLRRKPGSDPVSWYLSQLAAAERLSGGFLPKVFDDGELLLGTVEQARVVAPRQLRRALGCDLQRVPEGLLAGDAQGQGLQRFEAPQGLAFRIVEAQLDFTQLLSQPGGSLLRQAGGDAQLGHQPLQRLAIGTDLG